MRILIAVIVVWIAITSMIYGFLNPEKTEIQRFLHIPQSFILNFEG